MSDLNVLLVEDNADHQILLESVLTSGGNVRVDIVASGAACLESASTVEYDCLVVDYTLPDMSAAELIGRLNDVNGTVPIVVVSGRCDQQIVVECFRRGGVDFVPKIDAVRGDLLLHRVRCAVETRADRRAAVQGVERRIRRLTLESETDALTGLFNRRYFDRLIQETCHEERRRPFGCLLIDIDHFKSINDVHGHPAGDAILRGVADLIRSELAPGDHAVRWGGEEFLILHGCDSLSLLWFWAEKLRQRVQRCQWQVETKAVDVTISAGIVRDDAGPLDEHTVDRADQAMYLAKKSGRNRVCTWNMSEVDHALGVVERAGASHYARRRELLFEQCHASIGPRQREQATSHCWDVRQLSGAASRKLGLETAVVRRIEDAALLHDIGVVVVPEDLLAKPDVLTNGEQAMVNWRVHAGYEIARRLGADDPTADLVRRHQGRTCEGPRPVTASIGERILSAADALSSMMVERPYRRARSASEAFAELSRYSGTQFDTDVVRSFGQVLSAA